MIKESIEYCTLSHSLRMAHLLRAVMEFIYLFIYFPNAVLIGFFFIIKEKNNKEKYKRFYILEMGKQGLKKLESPEINGIFRPLQIIKVGAAIVQDVSWQIWVKSSMKFVTCLFSLFPSSVIPPPQSLLHVCGICASPQNKDFNLVSMLWSSTMLSCCYPKTHHLLIRTLPIP